MENVSLSPEQGVFDRLLDLYARLDEERKAAYLAELEQVSREMESELAADANDLDDEPDDPDDRPMTPEEARAVWDKTLRSPESLKLLARLSEENRADCAAGHCVSFEAFKAGLDL